MFLMSQNSALSSIIIWHISTFKKKIWNIGYHLRISVALKLGMLTVRVRVRSMVDLVRIHLNVYAWNWPDGLDWTWTQLWTTSISTNVKNIWQFFLDKNIWQAGNGNRNCDLVIAAIGPYHQCHLIFLSVVYNNINTCDTPILVQAQHFRMKPVRLSYRYPILHQYF